LPALGSYGRSVKPCSAAILRQRLRFHHIFCAVRAEALETRP
jgi:hypothetical protein